jgi:hypothetical protein
MVKIYVRLCIHVLKHSHNLYQGVGGTMFFTDHDNKYYSIGAQPGRAERGVQSGLYKMKHGFLNHH